MQISGLSSQLKTQSFGRKLREDEKQAYKETIQQGLKALDKKVGIIVHHSTTPSGTNENVGIGTLHSDYARGGFADLLSNNGIVEIQYAPTFELEDGEASPYSPMTTGQNALTIPIHRLASKEYGQILPDETLKSIIEKRPNKEDNTVDYSYARKASNFALETAYENFLIKRDSENPDAAIVKLAAEFEAFKAENKDELEPSALFKTLTKEHKTGDWKVWPEVDKNLYNTNTDAEAENAQARKEELREQYSKELDLYYFTQMIAEREIKITKEENAKKGISIIADSPVALTHVEEWQNQGIFMEDYALGCPPDEFAKDGQRWGFAVIDPKTIFNEDGTLGKGGELMKKRYKSMFSKAGGIRIDHIIGLVDPFVYSTKEEKMTPENSGRLYSSPNHPVFGQYTKSTVEEYQSILKNIVIPAAEECGLTKEDIICEDLGQPNPPTEAVMKALDLCGIRVSQFGDLSDKEDALTLGTTIANRDNKPARQKIIMLGSHDNKSIIEYSRDLFAAAEKDVNKKEEMKSFVHKLAIKTYNDTLDFDEHEQELSANKQSFYKAMLLNLFSNRDKHVQIFFTDFFGMDKTYNVPGSKEGCWTLRMPDNIEDVYAENLQNGKGINMPELIADAMMTRGEKFRKDNIELMGKLYKFANILKSEE